jgi:small GTP-binding protein
VGEWNLKQTIGLFAHVDAGKTTFAEQLLYISSSIGQAGRVDHQNAFMDRHVIEKERGITVFADQAILSWNGKNYDLIDTPGHVDFSSEMERALSVMDYAVVLISAVEGVEAHTETVWELLSKRHIPTLFFINKIDREGADIDKVLSEIQHQLTIQVSDFTNQFAVGSFLDTWTEEQLASLAEQDDEIMEKYIEGNYDLAQDTAYFRQRWIAKFQAGELFPCLSGSALSGAGVEMFLNMLEAVTEHRTERVPEGSVMSDQSDKSNLIKVDHESATTALFVGKVYKIRYDKQGVRYTYMKVLAGSLKVRDTLSYHTATESFHEKITKIVLVHGEELRSVQDVQRGDLFAVCGLTALPAGAIVGDEQKNVSYELEPALRARVIILSKEHPRIVWSYFCRLNDEDPALQASWYEKTGEIHIAVMGLIQLEVLIRVVLERFGVVIAFDHPEIIYKETISSSVFGYGHFEPLGHYAEVHLKLEQGKSGSGIIVNNECHPDDLAVGYQNLVLQHLQEREHHGLLTGSALTDVVITLINGRAHVKHTSGGDFREATYRALRQGLEKVESILLEPYYHVKIKAELDRIGKIMQDISEAHGKFDPPDLSDTHAIITGIVPVSAWLDYGVKLASYSQGRATMSLKLAGYFPCHVQDEIIHRIAYRKDADPEYTSSSIFCAKGQGFSVPWDEAEEQMHGL